MNTNSKHQVDYGNWVPMPLMILLAAASLLSIVLAAVAHELLHIILIDVILSLVAIAVLAMTLFMYACRRLFSFQGGGLMAVFHEFLASRLPWDGHGRLLDIGCGSGALSIRCAKRFPKARVVGIDYWAMKWNYARQQCEHNVRLEGVNERTEFLHGDASHLGFPDAAFDAVVSNFVFHEVKTQPDKLLLIHEALRVLKPGGSFALQDLFDKKSLYGDIHELLDELRREGYSELNYIAHVERQGFVPKYARMPWMVSDVGLLFGRKPAEA